MLAPHVPQDRWGFAANPAFPEALGGRPFLDRYVYRVIPEQTTLLTELLIENIDVYIAPRPDQAQQIIDNQNLELLNFSGRSYVFVGWNARKPQLADPRVRRAITIGTNRAEIVEAILQGYGQVANTGVPPFHRAYHQGSKPYSVPKQNPQPKQPTKLIRRYVSFQSPLILNLMTFYELISVRQIESCIC